jgi:hypothetical protein
VGAAAAAVVVGAADLADDAEKGPFASVVAVVAACEVDGASLLEEAEADGVAS